MILREIKHLYEKYKKTGKITAIQNQDLGRLYKDAYMLSIPERAFDNKNFDPSNFIRHPMFRLHNLWHEANSILGSIIHIELPLFLITLNGTFKHKFDSMLHDVIFKELKKYQHISQIGGVGCLDLLYNGPVENIKYVLIFDKTWDRIAVDIYSTLIIGDTLPQSGKKLNKIVYDLVFAGYFLEEKKEEYTSFYKNLMAKNCVHFYFYISKLHQKRHHDTEWWSPLSNFYEKYVQDVYHVSPEVTNEYQMLVENNKFFFRWALAFNYMLHHLSLYKDESLKEVRDIYRSLGIISRVNISASLLNGYESTEILFDWMLPGEGIISCPEERLEHGILNNKYNICKNHNRGYALCMDYDYNFVTKGLFDFARLVTQNNYGDVTAPIHLNYNKKDRSISFLSSIRFANEIYPKPLKYCVHPKIGVSVVNMDLYDELQLKLPEYIAKSREESVIHYAKFGWNMGEIHRKYDELEKKQIRKENDI